MKTKWFSAIAVVMIIALALVVPEVSAKQVFRWLHHESQGVGDQSFDQCLPEAAWNGHKHHEGDWQGDICIPDDGDGDDGDDGEDGGNGGNGDGVVGDNGVVDQPTEVSEPPEPRHATTGVNFQPGQCAPSDGTARIVEVGTGNTLAWHKFAAGDCWSGYLNTQLSFGCSNVEVYWNDIKLLVLNNWLCGGWINVLEVVAP